MPRKCCVPGCTSNYSSLKGSTSKSVFRFPNDFSLRDKWIRCIHRENFTVTKHSVVCEEHFLESDLIKVNTVTRPDSTVLTVPRQNPKLRDDAFPTIFKNQPSYLTTVVPKKRKSPVERRNKIDLAKRKREGEGAVEDYIKSFDDLKDNIKSHLNDQIEFSTIIRCNEIVLCIIDINNDGMPFIHKSVYINNNLETKVYFKNIDVTTNICKILNVNNEFKCTTWTSLCSLTKTVNNFSLDLSSDDLRSRIKFARDVLISCRKSDECISPLIVQIDFICEQLNLMLNDSPRYSTHLIVWACTLCFNYPAGYVALRNSGVLTLPHHRYLETFKMKLGTESTGLNNQQCAYLTKKKELLNERELYVNILVDEVYVKQDVTYKGGKIEGMVLGKDGPKVAETVQTFMISSITSNYKDVIGLFPQTHITADELHILILNVLKTLSSIGFKTVSVISDNNRANRKMFDLLSGGKMKLSITNPFKESDTIFLLFDTVHIFKCIRNNWMNQCDNNQTFWFPEPECLMNEITPSGEAFSGMCPVNRMAAKLSDLKLLHTMEQGKVVKLAPSLSRKVLYPTNVERQNVTLCYNLFDQKNIAALKTVENTTGTTQLMSIVSTWWNVVNTKSTISGVSLRDDFRKPIKSTEDKSIQFLKHFVKWLEQWSTFVAFEGDRKKRGTTCGKLTEETFFSLKHTTLALVEMSQYLIGSKILNYVLLGKFQNDDIEARFGQYRQMSGGTYYISVAHILESEKKLKAISMLKLKSSKNGEFQIKDLFLPQNGDHAEKECTYDFGDISELLDNVKTEKISHSEQMTLIYIAGYAVHKVAKATNCEYCLQRMQYGQTLQIEEVIEESGDYLKFIDRGGLKKPKPDFVNILVVMLQLFKLLTGCRYEEMFLKTHSQRQCFFQLSLEIISESNIVPFIKCRSCESTGLTLTKKIVWIFSNILLNNYSKVIKDSIVKSKRSDKRKVTKLAIEK